MENNSGKTILLVEDEAIIAIVESRLLRKEGYDVIHALTGEQAVDIVRSRPEAVDLILMDIDLGRGMDGTEAALEILQIRVIPVVFLSSHTEKEIVEKTEKITSYGYVVKNSGERVLLTSLKMAFRLFAARQEILLHISNTSALNEELQASNEELRVTNEDLIHTENALRQRENLLRNVLNSSVDYIYVKDRNLRTILCNETFAQALGKSPEELYGKTDIENGWTVEHVKGNPKKGIRGFEQDDLDALSGITVRIDNEPGLVSGKLRFFNTIKLPLLDGNENIIGILGISRDVTDQKMSEEALSRRENMLNRIFEILPVGLWFADSKGTLLRGNPAGIKIWGAEPKVGVEEYQVFKARHYPSGEEILPEDWALVRTIREKAVITDELLEIDSFDGSKKIILNYTAPILDESGELEGAIIVNQDVTKRTRLKAELDRERRNMESILSASPLGMLVFDESKNIIYANPAASELFGEQIAEHDKVKCGDFILCINRNADHRGCGYSVECSTCLLHQALSTCLEPEQTGSGPEGEVRIQREEGLSRVWIKFKSRSFDYNGKKSTLLIIDDISRRKQTEKKLAAAYKEKEILFKELQHRVKNSMNMILSLVQLGKSENTEAAVISGLDDIHSRISVLANLYEVLYAEKRGRIRLDDYLKTICDSLEMFFDRGNTGNTGNATRPIALIRNMEKIDFISRKASSIGLILNEFLTNAFKHSFPPGREGEIFINLNRNGDMIELAVTDNGSPLPENFHPADSPGYGMKLVQLLAEDLRGSLAIGQNGGKEFKVTFPG